MLHPAGAVFENMSYSTTFVTRLGAGVGAVLQNVSNLVAIVAHGLVAVLGAVPEHGGWLVWVCDVTSQTVTPCTWRCGRWRSTCSTSPCRRAPGPGVAAPRCRTRPTAPSCSTAAPRPRRTRSLAPADPSSPAPRPRAPGPCCPAAACCSPCRPPSPAPARGSPWRSARSGRTCSTRRWSRGAGRRRGDPRDTPGRSGPSSRSGSTPSPPRTSQLRGSLIWLEVWRGDTVVSASLKCCQVIFCYIDNFSCFVCCWCISTAAVYLHHQYLSLVWYIQGHKIYYESKSIDRFIQKIIDPIKTIKQVCITLV